MDESRFEVAGVAKVDELQFFAALVERVELKIGGCVIEPGHPLGGGAPRSSGHDDLEPAKVTASVRVLAAVIEPENSKCENAIDHRCRLCLAHADDGICAGAAQQAAAHIGGPEAVLEVHGRAQAINLGTDKTAGKHALQKFLKIAAGRIASRGGAAIARGNQLKRLRLGRAHAPHRKAQALRPLLQAHNGAHQVALFAPKLEQAAPVRLAHGVARGTHIEEHAAVLKQRRCRMID